MRYLPVIISNDREYTNTYHNTKEDAEKALKIFIEAFTEYNDSKIEKAFIREFK